MKVERRRKELIRMLRQTGSEPISGAAFAEALNVSRQIIVQDIAALKKSGYEILSTHKGYLLSSQSKFTSIIKVRHTDEETEEELNTIVDLGGYAVDVFIKHKVYGEIHAPLHVSSRSDVQNFLADLKNGKSILLKNVTSDYHYHTIGAPSPEIIEAIQKALLEKGMLASLLDYEKASDAVVETKE